MNCEHSMHTTPSAPTLPPRDRRMLLARASDPSTPIVELFELAMEFPDQVASNPSLPLALAADPCCVDGAGPVALACLLTSPAIPAAIAETIMRLIRGSRRNPTWDWSGTPRSRIVEEYLDAWRAAGSKLLAVDVSAIVPFAKDVPAEVERTTRGQALLARRLGWPGCSSWYTHCDGTEPLVRVHRPAGEDQGRLPGP